MPTFYLTFGQAHAHSVNGKTFDKDCYAAIEAPSYEKAREIAFEIFGPKWAFMYEKEEELTPVYYPRGCIFLTD